jgi:hypothetical protein
MGINKRELEYLADKCAEQENEYVRNHIEAFLIGTLPHLHPRFDEAIFKKHINKKVNGNTR